MARELEGRLISRSCATGWLDMIHGELWLFDDGLLRIRLNLAASMENGMGPTVPPEPLRKTFEGGEREALARAHRTNILIRWDEVADARLRPGLLCGRLRVKLRDGRTRKLLWLKQDGADEPLARTLAAMGHA